MADSKYNLRKAEQRNQLPEIDLLPIISHNGQSLDVAVFGSNIYRTNVSKMQKRYFHSAQLPDITFRPADVDESVSIASYGFENMVKPKIFDPRWLQTGSTVRWDEGVFINTSETDKTKLTNLLDGTQHSVKKHNGIYIIDNKIAFVPYGTFVIGIQSVGDFTRNLKTNGLARGLELSRGRIAPKLSKIGSEKHYKGGVDVFGWDSSDEPLVTVASLSSYRCIVGSRLRVFGLNGDDYGGYAFGVLDKSQSDALKK